MASPTTTRCPNPACRLRFDGGARAGEAATCPGCGQPLTIKPAAVWEVLDQRQQAHRAGDDDRLARLDAPLQRGAGSPRLRERLFHRPADEDAGWSAARYDVRYEAGADRPTPRAPADAGLVVVLDDLRSQWNVGAILRTAEGLGWGRAWLCGTTPAPTAAGVTRVSLGAERHLAWTYRAEVLSALEALTGAGFDLVALEQADDALALDRFERPERLALVVGNEVGGVSREALAACPTRLAIPMVGRKASLNVAVAFGIAAAALARPPDGDPSA